MVTSHIHHTSTTLGMTHDATDHIGVALFPTPFILLNFPRIDYIAYKI